MAGSVACASCGKEYRWKPELAGKRAKCKCGGVVSFPKADPVAAAAAPPPPPPPIPDVPEGFEDYGMSADAPPPPPPPPPPIPGRRPAAAAAPAAPATGGFKDSTPTGGGTSFHFNWKAALNVLIGLGLIGFGFVEFAHIGQLEARHETVHFTGRRSFYLTLMYQIGGRIGVLGFFILAGILFIGGAVLVMMGKIGHSDSKH